MQDNSAILQEPDWTDLRFVLAAARAGALAGAARQIGVNETTVSRRLARVERRLAVRLFERVGGRLVVTQAGARLVDAAQRMETEVTRAARSVAGAGAGVTGTVRLTSVPVIVNRLLIPAVGPLLAANPSLRIELLADPRDLSLGRREADVALRLARPKSDARAVTRRIGCLHYAVYCCRDSQPSAMPWLTHDGRMSGLPQARWIAAEARRRGEALVPMATNDAEGILAGVSAGLGKSLLPVAVADPVPGLRRVDGGTPPPSRELWLMVHQELRGLAEVRAVMDWLEATVGARDRSSPTGRGRHLRGP